MKVAILTSSHSTFDSRIFHKQARSLAEAGYDVTLITPHTENTEQYNVKIHAVGTEDVETAGIRDAHAVYRAAKVIDADIFHLHDPGLLPFGLLLTFTTDAKVIYDHHEQYTKAFRRYNFPPDVLNPLVSLYPTMQSLVCRRFDAIVTTTEEAAADFQRRGHATVVPIRNFPITGDISITQPPINRSAKHLLVYVGGLDETRGFEEMLCLISKLVERGMDIEAWMIGPINEEKKQVADEIGVSESVEFIGQVPHEEVFSYLHEGDIGLALLDPERFEQDIPLKLFEYMYSELPVVTTPIGASSKFIREEWGVIVPFDDVETQADEVAALLDDPERAQTMGRKGREMVETEFSWENEKERLLDLYREVCE
jgi:glycosyltransferase involved in cell wall biosynthesis